MVQDLHIEANFTDFKLYSYGPSSGYWIGKLQPNNNGTIYSVKIEYTQGIKPTVYVLEPRLYDNSPHRYSDRSLCLYYRYDMNYDNQKSLLSDTIIPWTAEWLYFYEIWTETGVWWGKEAPHTPITNIPIIEEMM